MALSLHSRKITDEKNAFADELYKSITDRNDLVTGLASNNAKNLHKYYLALYILNHFKPTTLNSEYFDYLITSIIESESLFMLGFFNAAMMSLRCALELCFKFLFFEYHPIELVLNEDGKFDLNNMDYREFLYQHPDYSQLSFLKKEYIERLWSYLCTYSHYDLKAVNTISVVSDIRPILKDTAAFPELICKLKDFFRVIVSVLFLTRPNWLEKVEKSYFDYPFGLLYSGSEISELKVKLKIV